jgi:hypothetical protein
MYIGSGYTCPMGDALFRGIVLSHALLKNCRDGMRWTLRFRRTSDAPAGQLLH